MIFRAIGPSLLIERKRADPTLELRDANGVLLEGNDNWMDSPNKQAIEETTIPPSNALESAIVRTLTPASYTAILRGVNADRHRRSRSLRAALEHLFACGVTIVTFECLLRVRFLKKL